MKLSYRGIVLILSICLLNTTAGAQLRARKNWRDIEPQTITLLSRAKYKSEAPGYGKSAFSFRYGVRSEVAPEILRNNYELEYGSINWNHDSDWFIVTMVTDDCSRIKDLGELSWSEVFDVPFLPASQVPSRGVRMPSKTETYEQSSEGQVTKAVAGHMYVVHSRDSQTDLYSLFRVEKLIPSDEVTISWKLVPSPEK